MAAYLGHLPCGPFTTGANVLACCKVARDLEMEEDDIRIEDAIEDASLILYYMTGRQFGVCSSGPLRPCVSCETCQNLCDCCGSNGLNLGLWPITEITSVWEDGEEQDVDNYHIDEYRYLVHNDPEATWPTCNSMYLEAGSEEEIESDHKVFEVVVEYGISAPRLIERATRELACELLQGCSDQPCKLPDRVVSQSRAGISRQLASANDLLRGGQTGIYTVDLAVQVLNPSRLQSPTFLITPEIRTHTRRVRT